MIQEMEMAEGIELAKKRLPNDTPKELLIELLEVLEFIPLAITQASAFMAKRRKTVQPYLDLYQKSDITAVQGPQWRVPAFLLKDEFDFQDAVAMLKAFSFIDSNEEDTMFSTHRLVQLETRCWLDQEVPSETEKWAFAALNSVATHFPRPTSHPDARYFTLGESLLPHAELVLQHQFKIPSKVVELARARLLNSSGRYLH
ncbi:hypothetical protein CEP54_010424 [Fusarium duplospermum]|uniref:DUF7779 domain-containing protein n=1 Tax=Fusarium duplospermum TaxID=1325734 RepID=A0A428PKC2_9HYPO|nr:hypothetical protein CEP54_010424 [Fusarium duplospermum]